MTRTRRLTAVAAAAVLALTLSACSDDGGGEASEAEQPYVDALMVSLDAEEELPLDDDEAECMATLMVSTVGVDRFEEAGIEPADLEDPAFDLEEAGVEMTDEDDAAFADGLSDCVDLVDLFTASMAQDESLSDEDVECVRENLDEAQLEELFAGELAGEEEPSEDAMSWVFELMAACPGLAGSMGE